MSSAKSPIPSTPQASHGDNHDTLVLNLARVRSATRWRSYLHPPWPLMSPPVVLAPRRRIQLPTAQQTFHAMSWTHTRKPRPWITPPSILSSKTKIVRPSVLMLVRPPNHSISSSRDAHTSTVDPTPRLVDPDQNTIVPWRSRVSDRDRACNTAQQIQSQGTWKRGEVQYWNSGTLHQRYPVNTIPSPVEHFLNIWTCIQPST